MFYRFETSTFEGMKILANYLMLNLGHAESNIFAALPTIQDNSEKNPPNLSCWWPESYAEAFHGE